MDGFSWEEPAQDEIPWFDPDLDPVRLGLATLPVKVGPDGALALPGVILWAFALNPGDLLAVRPEEGETVRFSFSSYGWRVRTSSGFCDDPWPYVEELLRQPLAAVGPGGSLELPAEAAGLVPQPGETLILRSDGESEPAFTLARPAGRLPEWRFGLEASYSLPLEPGPRVRLPPEVLWALSLSAGDLLAYEARWLYAEFQRADRLLGGSPTSVGEAGTVPVPARVLATGRLKSPERLTLKVFLSGRSFLFSLRPDLSESFDKEAEVKNG